jgi:coenzyme F420-reducing hydrogenase delta subunit/DNA-binding transcriptional ArsR family regulator
MCSGRVDLSFLLRAFFVGMDGVYVGGCHIDECHYITDGNYHALTVVLLCKKILQRVGLNPDRVRVAWTSAGEGIRFAEIMNEFAGAVKALGPLGEGEGEDAKDLKAKLQAALDLVPYIRLVERERLRIPEKSEEAYRAFYASAEADRIFDASVGEMLERRRIAALLKEKPMSTAEIARALGLAPSRVARHMSRASRQGLLRYDEAEKRYAPA